MKRLLFVLMLCIPMLAMAQEKGEVYGSVDLGYRYMWRGFSNGDAPAAMPTIGYSKGGFDVYAWGAFAFDDTYREINIGVSYSFSNFTLELVDYFYPWPGSDFFNFSKHSTTHTIEAIATYEPVAVPMHFTVGYTHEFNEKNSLSGVVGAALNKSFYNDYGKDFNLVNLTAAYTRVFSFWKFDEFPVTASYTYNPYLEKSYFNIMFTVGL